MIPFILLSLSGSSIHLHYCGHEGRLYADVHMASLRLSGEHDCAGNSHDEGYADHSSHASAASCCDPSAVNSCEEETAAHDDCCVDLEQPVVTDDNYKSSQFNLNFQITGIDLLEDHSYFHVGYPGMNSPYIFNDQNIPDSPDLSRLGILLL